MIQIYIITDTIHFYIVDTFKTNIIRMQYLYLTKLINCCAHDHEKRKIVSEIDYIITFLMSESKFFFKKLYHPHCLKKRASFKFDA